MKGSVRHLSPDGLHKNPAYSQAVVVNGNVKTVYVGGQNAVEWRRSPRSALGGPTAFGSPWRRGASTRRHLRLTAVRHALP